MVIIYFKMTLSSIWMILQHPDSPTALNLWFPPSPSVNIQTSKSWSSWNSVCIYWSDNILGDVLDIFLRTFALLGVLWTSWRHTRVITTIIIDHKLISKVVFTATGFRVLKDPLWPLLFPVSPSTLSLFPPWRHCSFAKLKNGWWPILMVALML